MFVRPVLHLDQHAWTEAHVATFRYSAVSFVTTREPDESWVHLRFFLDLHQAADL